MSDALAAWSFHVGGLLRVIANVLPVVECSQLLVLLFVFQAEDGIRDHCVTGVQTCALPISDGFVFAVKGSRFITHMKKLASGVSMSRNCFIWVMKRLPLTAKTKPSGVSSCQRAKNSEIGRASCRERDQTTARARTRNKKKRK